mmetsp:Transcript_70997/g.197218  ORF Transcript_70997/g.197218 Transcript_70997/m.197218 type:complete len:230 (-) Transcript_70997:75-764(-)
MSSIIIAIGTANPGKCKAVADAIATYDKISRATLQPCKVASGVADQPITLEETTSGAKNRAIRAAGQAAAEANAETAVWGIGMESGLFEGPDGRFYDICACCVYDGAQSHIGYSCAWALPDAVTAKIKEGMDLTQAANVTGLCDDPKIGDKGGLIAVLTGGRVTRPQYTVQSIQMALLAMDPVLYSCSNTVPPGINDVPAVTKMSDGTMMAVLAAAAAVTLVALLAQRR